MATSINTVHQGLHLHIEKPATANDSRPKARCRMCTLNGKKKVSSRWVCSGCPNQPGLCSQACFKAYHPSYEILLAARPLTAPSAPEVPEPNEEPGEGTSQQPNEQASELLSAADWSQRAECQHILVKKPPTLKKKAPTLKCVECQFQGRGRVERRTICIVCNKGFCCRQCLVSHHTRENI